MYPCDYSPYTVFVLFTVFFFPFSSFCLPSPTFTHIPLLPVIPVADRIVCLLLSYVLALRVL